MVISASCPLFAIESASPQNSVIQHESCALVSGINLKNRAEVLKAHNFIEAKSAYRYKVNGVGEEKVVQLELGDSNLGSRSHSIDKGEAELAARLSSLRYSGNPVMRLQKQDGTEIKQVVTVTDTHLGEFSQTDFAVSDTQMISASLVNVLEKATLVSTSEYYYNFAFTPVHETLVVRTELFSVRSVAKEILAANKVISNSEKILFKVIAGVKVSAEDKKQAPEELVRNMRKTLINYKLSKALGPEEGMLEKIYSALPSCEVVAK